MTRLTLPLLISALILSGCGRLGDSGWNPLSWRGAPATPETLAPEGGYRQAVDPRPAVPQLLAAQWQPLVDGRLLVVEGFAPVKGYHSAALVRAQSRPGDPLDPDPDGVLRLRFVAVPPPADAPRLPAAPVTDPITVALPFSFLQLSRLSAIEITGGDRIVTLTR